MTIIARLGLASAERVGLPGAPLLMALFSAQRPRLGILLVPAVLGMAAGVLVVPLDVMLLARFAPDVLTLQAEAPLWSRLAAGFLFGGINVEVAMRLFFVAGLVWLMAGRWRGHRNASDRMIVISVVISAFVFAAGHLPTLAAIGELTPALVARTLLFNILFGVNFRPRLLAPRDRGGHRHPHGGACAAATATPAPRRLT